MPWHHFLEPLRAYWARKRLERLHYEAAAKLHNRALHRESGERVAEDPDADAWRLIGSDKKELDDDTLRTLRDKARYLVDHNPYARNILLLHRNFVIGNGMKHEVVRCPSSTVRCEEPALALERRTLASVESLWREFLDANDWHTGARKDWEFCIRTWRDGECFLRLFRQPTWPPRVHFVDPEHIAPDPQTGLPSAGVETAPDNVELPLAYWVQGSERVPAELMLHAKINVDANVKRGVSLFLPVLDALKRFQGWLDVELIQRKVASSIVLVRKHLQSHPAGVTTFADDQAYGTQPLAGNQSIRKVKIQPGSIIDTQGFDLQFLSPNTHFEDASLLGRMILLSIAAGTGLPEYMLSADASNANYASTLVAEGPAVRHFAAWQGFFISHWQKLFALVLAEAVRLGRLAPAEARQAALHLTPPPLAVRNRHLEAQADALYFDRGALSARELARRDGADPQQMRRERAEEANQKRETRNEKPETRTAY